MKSIGIKIDVSVYIYGMLHAMRKILNEKLAQILYECQYRHIDTVASRKSISLSENCNAQPM